MSMRRQGYVWAFLLALLIISVRASAVTVTSPAFAQGKPLPAKCAREGRNVSPELQFDDIPAKAQSLVLIVDDPDAPAGLWTHWLVWNLPADTTSVPEGGLPAEARQGKNSFGNVRYDGPAPPAGTGVHRYFFRVYALDVNLTLPTGANRSALEKAMEGHVMGKGEIFGVFQHGPVSPL